MPKKKQQEEEQARVVDVSDHAVLRYIQRIIEVDTEVIRDDIVKRILDHSGCALATVDDGYFHVGDGHVAVIRSRRVVTILPEGFIKSPDPK